MVRICKIKVLIIDRDRRQLMYETLPDLQRYPFRWLDELIEISLNPELSPVWLLQPADLRLLENQYQNEIRSLLLQLKQQTFFLYAPKKIAVIVGHFAAAADILLERARQNLQAYTAPDLKHTGELILRGLEDFKYLLQKRYAHYAIQATTTAPARPELPAPMVKLICQLSVDQIGLILKAADDVQVIRSKSLSYVFKMIVPYLSTAQKKDLSWDSMRSSTYHPEENDKEIAVATLEKMINKIKAYH